MAPPARATGGRRDRELGDGDGGAVRLGREAVEGDEARTGSIALKQGFCFGTPPSLNLNTLTAQIFLYPFVIKGMMGIKKYLRAIVYV
jgi:hypothetical protein